jgi:hypothetical protein
MKLPPWAWMVISIILVTAADIALFKEQPVRAGTAISTLLLWCLVIGVGIGGIYAFMGHFFRADEVAQRIGWPAGNPFQREIAFTNLAIGVAGLCCFIVRDGFWLATIIVSAVFLIGAGIGHLHETKTHGNVSELNAGVIVAWDILFPGALILLWIGRAFVSGWGGSHLLI